MEENKKRFGKVGRAIIIGCIIFAILLVGFSLGASFNRARGTGNNFLNYRYDRLEGGRMGGHFNRNRNDNRSLNDRGAGCGARGGNLTPAAGRNFERQINKNGIQSDAIVAPSVVTSTETILK